jgi:hypothetical protein
MHWIKAHAGVPGNERVDYHAKMAAELPDCTDERVAAPSLSLSMLRRNIRKALAPPHEIEGGGAHRAIRHGIPPRVIEKALAKLPRGICSAIIQLRSGHCPLREYLHWRGHRTSANCLRCRRPETVRHYLMLCDRFARQRRKMRDALLQADLDYNLSVILSHPKAIPILVDYITSTRRFPSARPMRFELILPPH